MPGMDSALDMCSPTSPPGFVQMCGLCRKPFLKGCPPAALRLLIVKSSQRHRTDGTCHTVGVLRIGLGLVLGRVELAIWLR
jgi:hypothetical protein